MTDGDVRRGILRGVAMGDPVARIMNRAPVAVGPEVGRDELPALMNGLQVDQIPRTTGFGLKEAV